MPAKKFFGSVIVIASFILIFILQKITKSAKNFLDLKPKDIASNYPSQPSFNGRREETRNDLPRHADKSSRQWPTAAWSSCPRFPVAPFYEAWVRI